MTELWAGSPPAARDGRKLGEGERDNNGHDKADGEGCEESGNIFVKIHLLTQTDVTELARGMRIDPYGFASLGMRIKAVCSSRSCDKKLLSLVA